MVTKTETDPEIRDYAAMDNDIFDGLYVSARAGFNDIDIYQLVRVNPGEQANGPTVSYKGKP